MTEVQRQALIQIGIDSAVLALRVRALLEQAGASAEELQGLDLRLQSAIAEDEAERAARPPSLDNHARE